MKANSVARRHKRAENGALLAGLVHDDRGNRMTPSFTTKCDVRYRFYISVALLKGCKEKAGSLTRISGPDLEAAVIRALRNDTRIQSRVERLGDREIVAKLIERIEISQNKIQLDLKKSNEIAGSPVDIISDAAESHLLADNCRIDIAWQGKSGAPIAQIEESSEESNERDPTLVQAIARAHAWVKLLMDGAHNSIENLAETMNMHPKVVRKSIRLAFLAPDIMESILFGRHSKSTLTLGRLHDANSLSWVEQMRQLKTYV